MWENALKQPKALALKALLPLREKVAAEGRRLRGLATPLPLIPAKAGIQIVGREASRTGRALPPNPPVPSYDLDPGLRRDER